MPFRQDCQKVGYGRKVGDLKSSVWKYLALSSGKLSSFNHYFFPIALRTIQTQEPENIIWQILVYNFK